MNEAAARWRQEIVGYLLTVQGCTRIRRIEAWEMLGTAYLLRRSEYHVRKGYRYLMKAMSKRFSDPKKPLLKRILPRIAAYGDRLECRTVAELEALQSGDSELLYLEALIVKERILGKSSAKVPKVLVNSCDTYDGPRRTDLKIKQWLHALELSQANVKALIWDDLTFVVEGLSEIYSRQPEIIGFEDLEKFIELSLNEVDFISDELVHPFCIPEQAHQYETLLEKVVRSVMGLFWIATKVNRSNSQDLTLCKLGYEFVHRDEVFYPRSLMYVISDEFKMGQLTFPNEDLIWFLIHCGMYVTMSDDEKNTPLHLMAALTPPSYDPEAFHGILAALIEAGLHLDSPNMDGVTPKNILIKNSRPAPPATIQHVNKFQTLKCEAAKIIKKHNIPYVDVLPGDLEDFIEIH